MKLERLGQDRVLAGGDADVELIREENRQARLRRVVLVLAVVALYFWARLLAGATITWGRPHLPPALVDYLPAIVLVVLLGLVLAAPLLAAGRSPHVLYRPSEIGVGLDDVRGAPTVVEEVTKTLNLFLAFRTFREAMGGTARRAVLFEGPPGTGKTYVAKAIAREAGVPFLFVSSSAFQSMYYGQTNRKIRSYFKALRAAARREGGAVGFIEEIDAIGATRAGMGSSSGREGISGVVNELLIQLQSFDAPPGDQVRNWMIDLVNQWLPARRQLAKRRPVAANILVIGATNRAGDLDPALLRPGRFDRCIYFDLPSRRGRREIIDYYLDRKAHEAELDDPGRRDALAAQLFGYSPVMIEHLLDEGLVWALRRGAGALSWADLQQAKMTDELGTAQGVEYTEAERRAIATHEAGHATVAHLVGRDRKLDVLSIIKRRDALGLLAHSDKEERFTKSRSEIVALIQIAMGGMAAEEIFFGEVSTGPAGDLLAATTAAAQMVGSLGMAGSLISLDAMSIAGAGNVAAKVLTTDHGREWVDRILDDAKRVARDMIDQHRVVVEALRDALLERDELVGDEILAVIEGASQPGEIDLRDGAGLPR